MARLVGWLDVWGQGKWIHHRPPMTTASHVQPTLVTRTPSLLDLLTWQRYPLGWATQVAPCWQGLDWHGFTLSWHILPWNPGGQ